MVSVISGSSESGFQGNTVKAWILKESERCQEGIKKRFRTRLLPKAEFAFLSGTTRGVPI
jgi:hypothetical protein